MNCRKKQENISAYFDGELDEKGSAQVLSHVDECDECSSYFKQFKMLQNKMNLQVERKEVPPHIETQLMQRIRLEGAGQYKRSWSELLEAWFGNFIYQTRPALRTLEFALVFLVALFAGIQMYRAFGPGNGSSTTMIADNIQPVMSKDFVRDDLADFFAKSSRILERIKNSRISDSTQLAAERQLASELLVKSQLITHKLGEEHQEQAGKLMEELEPLLIDVANYDRQHDRGSIDLWKSTIDRNNYIARINSMQINQASFNR